MCTITTERIHVRLAYEDMTRNFKIFMIVSCFVSSSIPLLLPVKDMYILEGDK